MRSHILLFTFLSFALACVRGFEAPAPLWKDVEWSTNVQWPIAARPRISQSAPASALLTSITPTALPFVGWPQKPIDRCWFFTPAEVLSVVDFYSTPRPDFYLRSDSSFIFLEARPRREVARINRPYLAFPGCCVVRVSDEEWATLAAAFPQAVANGDGKNGVVFYKETEK